MNHDHSHHDHSHHDMSSMLNNTINSTLAGIVTTVATAIEANHSMDNHLAPEMHDHSMHTTDSPHGNHGVHMDMDMQMYFHVAKKATILFKEWNVDSVGGMVGSVIGIILLAVMYEGLKFLREHLFRQYYSRLSYTTCTVSGQVETTGGSELHKVTQNRLMGWPHLLQTSLHITQVLLSYFLMLIFMTYNVWLCLAVLIGSGFGYFFFGWRKSTVVDISDHCH